MQPTSTEKIEIVVTHPAFRSRHEEDLLSKLYGGSFILYPSRSAGIEYPALACSFRDCAVFTWEKPWDHAAGLLLHSEAGGYSSCMDYRTFRISGGNALPIIAASSDRTFDLVRRALT